MIIKNSIFILSLVIFLCSCAIKETKEDTVIKMLGDELENSSKIITANTNDNVKMFEDKLANPITSVKAWQIQPKFIFIQNESKIIYALINTELKKENIDWDSLAKKINVYKEKILTIDTILKSEFGNKINRVDSTLDPLSKASNLNFMNSISKIAQKAILKKMINRVKILENELLQFYAYSISGCILTFDKFSCLVAQSTNHLKVGEQLEITAGVGSFSVAAKPIITFGDKNIEVIDGIAAYKIKAVGAIGKHTIPVNIDFVDQNGTKKSQLAYVEYTIDK